MTIDQGLIDVELDACMMAAKSPFDEKSFIFKMQQVCREDWWKQCKW